MADDVITIIAALIGAVIGSLGAKLVEEFLKRRAEKVSLQRTIVNQYLLQLQGAIESLWYRLDTLKKRGARMVTQDKYFEVSTLYSLACVLAYRRILLLEGVYSKIEQAKRDLGSFLNERLIGIDSILENFQTSTPFYRYERLILAETVIQRIGDRLGTHTYLEFKKQYDDSSSGVEESLKPAKDFLSHLSKPDIGYFMEELKQIAIRVGDETRIASSLIERT